LPQTFEFRLAGDVQMKLLRIQALAAKKHVTFTGDTEKGSFYGGFPLLGQVISGTYRIVGDMVSVKVMQKPSMYSWAQVEEMLRGFVEAD